MAHWERGWGVAEGCFALWVGCVLWKKEEGYTYTKGKGKNRKTVTEMRTVYRIVWPGYLPEAATWEPVENVGAELRAEYEQGLRDERPTPRRPPRS